VVEIITIDIESAQATTITSNFLVNTNSTSMSLVDSNVTLGECMGKQNKKIKD